MTPTTTPTDAASLDSAPPLRQLAVVAIVLAVSILVTVQLVAAREEAVGETPAPEVPTVEVATLTAERVPVTIACTGRIEPVSRLEIASQLAARVARIGDDFRVGRRVEAGALLFELDDTDARLAEARALAALSEAEAALQLEEAQAETAIAEWRLVGEGEPGPLVRREPQLAAARAAVASAQVQIDQARTDLGRTRVTAPFAGRIASRDADLGQYLVPGQVVGQLIGEDGWEVRLAVSGADQPFLERPDGDAAPKVELELGDTRQRVDAALVRVAPEVDPRTQTLLAFARIDAQDTAVAARYGAGSFVHARVEGRVLEDAFVLPRSALRGNDTVLVIGAASQVFRRPVEVARRTSDSIVVTAGLAAGERVVVSDLAIAADGMVVEIAGSTAEGARPE